MSIRHRCYNPKKSEYVNYGAKGVTLYLPWHDVTVFVADIERLLGPKRRGMSLDRINPYGNYDPGNVRWATRRQQALNRRARLRLLNVPQC